MGLGAGLEVGFIVGFEVELRMGLEARLGTVFEMGLGMELGAGLEVGLVWG